MSNILGSFFPKAQQIVVPPWIETEIANHSKVLQKWEDDCTPRDCSPEHWEHLFQTAAPWKVMASGILNYYLHHLKWCFETSRPGSARYKASFARYEEVKGLVDGNAARKQVAEAVVRHWQVIKTEYEEAKKAYKEQVANWNCAIERLQV